MEAAAEEKGFPCMLLRRRGPSVCLSCPERVFDCGTNVLVRSNQLYWLNYWKSDSVERWDNYSQHSTAPVILLPSISEGVRLYGRTDFCQTLLSLSLLRSDESSASPIWIKNAAGSP
ncbi:hypothetical protein EYF80_027790 [Liparis tanakae]|uniref:Uncharacterized protein n=1 Tax=Liparis tanakae TaxID=230148 RepID=A0A4Z2H9M0_9TELE|nr:hypothetical protein EYF80_027790 [Liparis tanakae]